MAATTVQPEVVQGKMTKFREDLEKMRLSLKKKVPLKTDAACPIHYSERIHQMCLRLLNCR